MTVYIEYAFLDNFTMDFLLLFLSAITLKMTFRWWRIVLGAMLGTVIALLSVFVDGFWNYLCKAVCLFAMCVVAVGFGKKLFWHILLTLAYTFITGGAIVGIFNLCQVDYATENGFCYNMPVPLFVYLFAVAFVAILGYFLWVFFQQNKKVAQHLVRVKITLDKTYNVLGFCDSGNTVTCCGKPVCFVTKKFGNVSQFFATKVLHGECERVEVNTITGSKKVFAFQVKIEVKNICSQVFLALPPNKSQTQYELLLNSEFCVEKGG